jgi:hypothetical protein
MVHASELEPESETTEATEETVQPPVVSRTTTIEIGPVEEVVPEEPEAGYRTETVSTVRAAFAITPATSAG